MRRAAPRKRASAALRKFNVAPDALVKIGELLRETGVIAGNGDPVAATGYADGRGTPKRIIARYANGWRVDFRMRADGSYSISQSLKLTSERRGA